MLVILLAPEDGAQARWLRVDEGAIAARGEGYGVPEEGERVVAVLPANEVALHWAGLPEGLAPAQATAAARLLAADASLTPPDRLHVAVGPEAEGGERVVALADAGTIARRLTELGNEFVDPDALLPAALVVPVPEEGYARADLGSEIVWRGPTSAFANDPVVTPLIVGEAPVHELSREEIEAALVTACADPPLDLRQGAFAKRHRFKVEASTVRRMAVLAGVAALLALASQAVLIVRTNLAANAAEQRVAQLAATALPAGTPLTNAPAQLDQRLAAMRGAGAGFLPTSGVVAKAVEAVPNAELAGIVYEGNGRLRATVRAASPGEIAAVQARITGAGFGVAPGAITTTQGRAQSELTVTGQ